MRDSLGGPTIIKNPLSAKLPPVAAVAILIAGAWLILYLWVHFQLVERQAVDYLLLLGVGLVFLFLLGSPGSGGKTRPLGGCLLTGRPGRTLPRSDYSLH